jgi:hypothetical protein
MVEIIRQLCDVAVREGDPVGGSIYMLAWSECPGEDWQRRVWRHRRWRQFAFGDDPMGWLRAGEVVVEFVADLPIKTAYLVTGEVANGYIRLEARQTESGTVKIDLPDGRVIERPDPRDWWRD